MVDVAVLELNELNFDALSSYAERGHLPNFSRFFEKHGYCETTSEVAYAELEPWIQWVTVHTGKSFAEHGIFRLGDAVASNTVQIWERLEQEFNLRVGAVSPMNAANRLLRPAFFIPDPWTPTPASGSWLVRRVSKAVSQAVNDNASGRLTISSLATLLLCMARYGSVENYSTYLSLLLGARFRSWHRVSFLDLLLGDLFIGLTRKAQPQFSTLFVNGAAHLQHHYLLNSPAYRTEAKNPGWYVKPDQDPVGDIYRIYDRLLGSIQRALPGHRILLVTGLHQEPYGIVKFYWRLRNHEAFLRTLDLSFREALPRMSRDFIVRFDSRKDLERAKAVLSSARINNEIAFTVADRGDSIFVELVFPHEIVDETVLRAGDIVVPQLGKHVVFIALKNGHHNGTGYFSDSGRQAGDLPHRMPLTQLHDEMVALFDPGASKRRAKVA